MTDLSQYNKHKNYKTCNSCGENCMTTGKICECPPNSYCYNCAIFLLGRENCPKCNQAVIVKEETEINTNYPTNKDMVMPYCSCDNGNCLDECACKALNVDCKYDCQCSCSYGDDLRFTHFDRLFIPISSLPDDNVLHELVDKSNLNFKCGCELYSTCEENCFCKKHGVICDLCACCHGDTTWGNCRNGWNNIDENDEFWGETKNPFPKIN
eukprot:TRINITY_DN1589_c1_g1_i1.p1 TRINITY_DN1589_c1_g1~~TRINITY_DN1589_c1_g1_i1.p1  ORF type:complete len:211 (-),score=16.28 TRINITY_DN1589_c1_g1_i1:78-710(-)